MHSTDPEVPAPSIARDGPTRAHTFWRAIGWGVSVLAVPLGITLSWMAAWLGNCKWGFFGDTGPAMGAGTFTLNDLGVQSIGWLVAFVPWVIIARFNPRENRRRGAALVAVGVSAVVLVGVILPQLGGASYWEQVCT